MIHLDVRVRGNVVATLEVENVGRSEGGPNRYWYLVRPYTSYSGLGPSFMEEFEQNANPLLFLYDVLARLSFHTQRQKGSTMGLTTNPEDPELHRTRPDGQNEKYLVLSEEERARGFVRPVRNSYRHTACGTVTTMNRQIAETYARNPLFYGATFCSGCLQHFHVSEFTWEHDGFTVGS